MIHSLCNIDYGLCVWCHLCYSPSNLRHHWSLHLRVIFMMKWKCIIIKFSVTSTVLSFGLKASTRSFSWLWNSLTDASMWPSVRGVAVSVQLFLMSATGSPGNQMNLACVSIFLAEVTVSMLGSWKEAGRHFYLDNFIFEIIFRTWFMVVEIVLLLSTGASKINTIWKFLVVTLNSKSVFHRLHCGKLLWPWRVTFQAAPCEDLFTCK